MGGPALRILALALVLVGLGAVPAAAAPGIVLDVGGQKVTLGAPDLQAGADVPPTTYVVAGQPQTLTGTSLRRAIGLAGADPDSISAVTLDGGDATIVQLLRTQLSDPPPFAEGPALLWIDDLGRTNLLRPAGGDGDAAEVVSSPPGQPLLGTVEGVTLVEVAVIASVDKAKVGQRIPMLAQSSAADGATYTWDFDDGTEAEGGEVTHAFTRPGRYRVTVRVADGSGGGGSSQPVTIVVGEPRRPQPGTEPQGGSGAETSADAGVAADPVPAQAPAPAPAQASAPAPAPPPKALREKATRKAETEPAQPPAAQPEPGTVSGTLLADASDPASSAVAAAVAAAARTPVPDGRDPELPAWAYVALGALLAFSAGALVERRGLRPRP